MTEVYLDSVASTPLAPEVFAAMMPYFKDHFGNPSALHRRGRLLKNAMEKARQQAATFLGAGSAEEILFTSGGTEAANLAIQGLCKKSSRKEILVGATEHPAVFRSAEAMQKNGFVIREIPVDTHGRVSPESVRMALSEETLLVAVQLVSHDLGTIQPIAEIAKEVHAVGALLCCDASAATGWGETNVGKLGVDLLWSTPHRFYGPPGVGILYCKSSVDLGAILYGGKQERGLRAGMENVPAIVGAGAACELAQKAWKERSDKVSHLQKLLYQKLAESVERVRLNGPLPGAGRSPHHLSLSFEGVEGEALMLRLDLKGVACTSVTGCAVKDQKIPRALRAIGLPDELSLDSVIFGLHPDLSDGDIAYAVEQISGCVNHLRGMSLKWKDRAAGREEFVCPLRLPLISAV